jgi:hypothetical protein
MFSPSTGRFTQPDPIGFAAGDPNLYRFVGNDPTSKTDPSGLQAVAGVATLRGGTIQGALVQALETGNVARLRELLRLIRDTGLVVANAELLRRARAMVAAQAATEATARTALIQRATEYIRRSGEALAGVLRDRSFATQPLRSVIRTLNRTISEMLRRAGVFSIRADVERVLDELARRYGIHRRVLGDRFHRIKDGGDTPGPRGRNCIDDVTGDVYDGNGNHIGNVINDY